MMARAPERTRCGSDSVTATNEAEVESVEALASTPHAMYSATADRSRSSNVKQGKTATARQTQGTTMTGLRPNRSESHPPKGSHTTPQKPTMAVAPKAIFAGMPSVEPAYVVMYSSR